jgi:phage gp29-like protein
MASDLQRRVLRAPAIQQWTSGIKVHWTPEKVRRALYSHQDGDFEEASLMSNAMLIDDEYAGSLERAIEAIVGAPFSLAPEESDGEPDAASQTLADEIEPLWYDMVPEAQLVQLIRWYLQLGIAVGTLDWTSEGGQWIPKLRTLSPEFLTFKPDEKNYAGVYGKWVYQSRDDPEEEVIPGNGRWVLLVDGRDGWVSCAIRALGNSWLGKQLTWRDWLRFNERHGLPIVKAMVPSMAPADEKQQYANDVSSLGSDTTVLLPTNLDPEHPEVGFDLDLVEAKDQAWETFERTIERCDRKFQIYFLGSNAATELTGSVGSRAAAESSQDTTRALASSRARRISTYLRAQVVKPFAEVNMANVPTLPWPQWEIDPKETLEARAAGVKVMGEALVQWKNAGYQIDNIEAIALESGLEVSEREEEPEPVVVAPGKPVDTQEQLSEDGTTVGDRDGMIAGQEYTDGLAEHLAGLAENLEEISAEQMSAILSASTGPDDLRERLKAYVDDEEPVKLARLFEAGMLLSQYAGALGVEQDL